MAVVFDKPKSLTDNVLHYCPGCTHGIIHRLVAEVIDELSIEKGAHEPGAEVAADLSVEQAFKIARMKFDSLLANDYKAATKEIMGTCVSMGITVDGKDPRDAQKAVDAGEYDDILVE